MNVNDLLNAERVNALGVDPNAYVVKPTPKPKHEPVKTENISKVVFPEPYENATPYYNKHEFSPPPPPNIQPQQNTQPNAPFDFKSLLPMLMSGKFNDMLKPLMSMMSGGGSGGGLGDISKIFELFKPKAKPKKQEKKEEDVSSKFDDMIIIED